MTTAARAARRSSPGASGAGVGAGADDGFTIGDVAGDLVAKLIRRNPHVFGDAVVADLDEITRNWEQIKRAEKSRTSAMDGLALSQPALTLAAQVLTRAERSGLPVPPVGGTAAGAAVAGDAAGDLARRLLDLVVEGRSAGIDAEAALRQATLDLIAAVRTAEPDADDDTDADAEVG